jgi:hypothetical protein
LDLLAQRLSNKETVAELRISPETIKTHLNNIYGKSNVTDRRQVVDKGEILDFIAVQWTPKGERLVLLCWSRPSPQAGLHVHTIVQDADNFNTGGFLAIEN